MPDDNAYGLPIPDFNDPGFQEQYIKALKAAYDAKFGDKPQDAAAYATPQAQGRRTG